MNIHFHINWYVVVWLLHIFGITGVCCVGINFHPVREFKAAPRLFTLFALGYTAFICIVTVPLTIIILI